MKIRFAACAIVASVMALHAPAFAQEDAIPGRVQSSETSDRTPDKKSETPTSQVTKVDGETSSRTPEATGGNDSQDGTSKNREGRVRAMSIETLKESLDNAGFRDVRVVDASYVVHAKTSDGDLVIMRINPPTVVKGKVSRSAE